MAAIQYFLAAFALVTRPGLADDSTSLLQVSQEVKKHGESSHDKAKRPLSNGWFGAFSEGESSYTMEGNKAGSDDPQKDVTYGRDPGWEYPYAELESDDLKPEWFHESGSGGAANSWQTGSPRIPTRIAGNRDGDESWTHTPDGWIENYRPESNMEYGILNGGGGEHAQFFDNSIHNEDGFGRKMRPDKDDGEFYIDSYGWKERSVNTTLSCQFVNCTAAVSLQLYDPKKEDARLCKLSIGVHPTDYDDDWSREHVEFLKANGALLTKQCNPRARGCNMTANRPLYPCVNAVDIDKIVDDQGTVNIEGKNTHMVDECPYMNMLLSGVITATCMVRDKVKPPVLPPPPKQMAYAEGILKCTTPGCNGTSLIMIDPQIAMTPGGLCCMNVSVAQTDFDDHLGVPEQVDFISINNMSTPNQMDTLDLFAPQIIAKDKEPGKNPCTTVYADKTAQFEREFFNVVHNNDITDWVKYSKPAGTLDVRGRISPQVDECGYKGNLLYGLVTVTCTLPDEGKNMQFCHNQWTSFKLAKQKKAKEGIEQTDSASRAGEERKQI